MYYIKIHRVFHSGTRIKSFHGQIKIKKAHKRTNKEPPLNVF